LHGNGGIFYFMSIFDAIVFYSDIILHLAKLQAIVLWLPF